MKYRCATLWHRNEDGSYKRILFQRAYITKADKTEMSGGERNLKNSLRVRLYTLSKCDICVGDYICDGYDSAISPPEDAFIIVSLYENFGVSARLRHYRAECR